MKARDYKAAACARRIRSLRNDLNLRQEDVSNYVGVTRVTISQWENAAADQSRFPATKYLKAMAYILQTTEIYIMYGYKEKEQNVINANDLIVKYNKMPLVTFDYLIKKECKMGSTADEDFHKYVIGTFPDKACFCMPIDDDSMSSRKKSQSFHMGDKIYIDPSRKPKPGNYVIANVNNRPYFRQLRKTNDKLWLKAINEDYKDIKKFNGILGVVYEYIMAV